MKDRPRRPSYVTLRGPRYAPSNATVCVGVPGSVEAMGRAFEPDHWTHLAVFLRGVLDLRDAQFQDDESNRLRCLERLALFGVFDVLVLEVECVQVRVIEETDNAHPGACYTVGVLSFE